MEWATLVVSIVALAVSAWAVVDGRLSARRANAAAERSAAAAEQQVELAKPPEVAFEIARGSIRDGFVLINRGTGLATGVTIDTTVFPMCADLPMNVSLQPGQGHAFTAAGSAAAATPGTVPVRSNQRRDPIWVPMPQ